MAGAVSQQQRPASSTEATVMSAGNVLVDAASYRVTVAGETVALTFQEFELLRLFVGQAHRIIPYDMLAGTLWNSTGRKEVRRLGVVVCRLRAKLAASWPYKIETVRGRGYGLVAEASASG